MIAESRSKSSIRPVVLPYSPSANVQQYDHEEAFDDFDNEILVIDDRSATRPGQFVENKLCRILHESAGLGVSQLRLKNLISQRRSR